MRHALLWILLLGLSLAVVVMASGNGLSTIGDLTTGDFASLLVSVAWLVLITGVLIALFRDRLTKALEAAVLWIVIALLLMLGYTYRFQLHDIADQVMAELVPGRIADSGRTVALARAQSSDFQITTDINGHSIPMILDTGASSVVLTQQDAKAAGLPLEVLNYTVSIDTANGRTRAAKVTLDRLAVGGLEERSVEALIVPSGQLRTSLLGMSFLNRLQSWQVTGDRLIMHGYP